MNLITVSYIMPETADADEEVQLFGVFPDRASAEDAVIAYAEDALETSYELNAYDECRFGDGSWCSFEAVELGKTLIL